MGELYNSVANQIWIIATEGCLLLWNCATDARPAGRHALVTLDLLKAGSISPAHLNSWGVFGVIEFKKFNITTPTRPIERCHAHKKFRHNVPKFQNFHRNFDGEWLMAENHYILDAYLLKNTSFGSITSLGVLLVAHCTKAFANLTICRPNVICFRMRRWVNHMRPTCRQICENFVAFWLHFSLKRIVIPFASVSGWNENSDFSLKR